MVYPGSKFADGRGGANREDRRRCKRVEAPGLEHMMWATIAKDGGAPGRNAKMVVLGKLSVRDEHECRERSIWPVGRECAIEMNAVDRHWGMG